MNYDQDTIAAIATAPGQGGIGIVRMSGPDAERILSAVFRPAGGARVLLSHMLTYGRLTDGEETVDECMAVLMRAPRTYTREDVAELQIHGGSYLCRRVLSLCLREGARLAEPGEFTRRAFLNGRLDLAQAEAVMGIISARGEQARKAAVSQLEGGPSAFIREAADELYAIAAGIAACVDYPEEISEEEAAGDAEPRIRALADKLRSVCDERAAHLLSDGLSVVLCGRPNAGKSSLLNALLHEDRAIVTDIPGTTRDRIEGSMQLGGMEVHLTDTAGIRETDDPVEQAGVTRSQAAIRNADVVLDVIDASRPLDDEDRTIAALHDERWVLLLNKCDLPRAVQEEEAHSLLPGASVLELSAKDGDSLAPLCRLLEDRAAVTDRMTLTQPRHLDAARRAADALDRAADTLRAGLSVDFSEVDLQAAAAALGEITGDQIDEKVLDNVFSRFCVGK